MKKLSVVICALWFISNSAWGQINCPPHLPFTLQGNTEYCVGTLGTDLSVPEPYAGYEWLPTTEIGQNVFLSAGSYQLVVTHYTGCTDTMDIEIEQVPNPPQPVITASGATEVCEGEGVTLIGPSGYPYYEWNSGSVSESITVYESGTYVLSVEDWIGCGSASNAIQVIVNPNPTAAFSPDVDGYDVSFNNLSYDATTYEWNFGDGTVSSDFEPIHTFNLDGAVNMYLVAENDCGTDTAFLDLTSVDIEDIAEISEFVVYPNPTAAELFLEFDSSVSSNLKIQLFDLSGRVVSVIDEVCSAGQNIIVVGVEQLPSGIYLLKVNLGVFSHSLRVMISH